MRQMVTGWKGTLKWKVENRQKGIIKKVVIFKLGGTSESKTDSRGLAEQTLEWERGSSAWLGWMRGWGGGWGVGGGGVNEQRLGILLALPNVEVSSCHQSWGDKVESGIGLSYRPACQLTYRLACRLDNPMPESSLSPSQGLWIRLLVWIFIYTRAISKMKNT
jgi:hypothetical protein